MPTLERVKEERDSTFTMMGKTYNTGSKTITYSWKESGTPPPRYIMLDTPVACNPADLAVLTQRMPVTPASDAIHAVLYSSNPLQRGIVHKQGPAVDCSTKEGFETRGITEESCDPWKTWAQTADKTYSTQQIFTLIFNIMIVIAMGVGAFLALIAVLRMYDVEYKDFSEGLGKVTAVFFKNMKEKVAKVKGMVSNVRGLAAGKIPGAAGKGGLPALANETGGLPALTNGPPAAPGGLVGVVSGTEPGSVLANVAGIATPPAENPFASLANLPEAPTSRRPRTRRAAIPLDRRLVGPESIPVPTAAVPVPTSEAPPAAPQGKKWNTVQTPYVGSTGFVRRGGRTLRRDRDRGDRSRTTQH